MSRSTDQIFDELLVLNFRNGDDHAMALLMKRWHPKLMRQIARHTKSWTIGEDIAQDCWETIVRRISSLNDPALFGPWALRIASFKAIDWIRQKQKERENLKHIEPVEEEHEEHDLTVLLQHAIQLLPEDQRMTLSLFYLEGHQINEIADILSIPMGTVKSRLYHAREHLKEIINKERNEKEQRGN